MSSTASRGEFIVGGEGKRVDFSLLLDEEGISTTSSSPEPQEQKQSEQLVEERPKIISPNNDDSGSWNTVHKPQHGSHSSSIPVSSHSRNESIGSSFGKSPRNFQQNYNNSNANAASRKSRPILNQQPHNERKPIVLSSETTIEMYNFPAAYRTPDLKKVLESFEGKYRIKWNNDTSCWFVFNSPEDSDAALLIQHENIKIKRYDPANYPIPDTDSVPIATE